MNILGWKIDNTDHLTCTIDRPNFKASMALANDITDIAESLNHHPDLTIKYKSVGIKIRTHDQDAVTDKDYEFARAVNQLL